MPYRCRLPAGCIVMALGMGLSGCGLIDLTNFFSKDFLSSLGLGARVAYLPGEAPGLLVAVENRTNRPARMVVAYRDVDDNVKTYTTTVAPHDKSATMLVCPVKEITLGDVSNLNLSGAAIYLVESAVSDPDALQNAPYIEVDAFGVLLREEVNYKCGDGLVFTVEPSSLSRSGYQVFAYIRPSSKM